MMPLSEAALAARRTALPSIELDTMLAAVAQAPSRNCESKSELLNLPLQVTRPSAPATLRIPTAEPVLGPRIKQRPLCPKDTGEGPEVPFLDVHGGSQRSLSSLASMPRKAVTKKQKRAAEGIPGMVCIPEHYSMAFNMDGMEVSPSYGGA
mmetsp:Transcript_19177/g.34725  ORF Transcript_19177/g.34725 Transcript_19177/m.34725 type:complete len:151 (-) Transcript_19177:59-511(-)